MSVIICGIDPNPMIPRQCVCDMDPEILCEFPCWQRDGLDDQYDQTNPKSCCCYREGSKYKPRTAEQVKKEQDDLMAFIDEKIRERAR